MLRKFLLLSAVASAVLVIGVVHADDKLTWFGETVYTGAYPAGSVDTGALANLPDEPSTLLRLQSRSPTPIDNQVAIDRVFSSNDTGLTGSSSVVRSEVGFAMGEETFSIPMVHRDSLFSDGTTDELNALGLKWRHQFAGLGSLTLATHYGQAASGVAGYGQRADTANTLTSVSWTSDFGPAGSSVMGSLFYGNEQPENSPLADPARRVYGLAVGGQWALSERHLPYVALRYQSGDPASGLNPTQLADYTRISAGWNWRVNRGWNVRAEANFTYDQPTWDLFHVRQTNILFSTRFDLR
jgi:hypothetical protein